MVSRKQNINNIDELWKAYKKDGTPYTEAELDELVKRRKELDEIDKQAAKRGEIEIARKMIDWTNK